MNILVVPSSSRVFHIDIDIDLDIHSSYPNHVISCHPRPRHGYRLQKVQESVPAWPITSEYRHRSTMATMRVSFARHGANPLRTARANGNFTHLRPGVPQPSKWHQHRALSTSAGTNMSSSPSPKPVIFSGIQPTGVPHLGNYLGALREWVKLQDTAEEGTKLLFSIVDLHALTIPQDAKQLRTWRREAFATLLAVGLDPKRSTIFYQSSVCCSTSNLKTNNLSNKSLY